ncbi:MULTISPECIES: iron chelate uptake ABC transporter family permease subunit [unclassified Halomonas]|uniref:iron chelate uptake ABC transporter family permease subunit n=2 Tax=Halomonas TaxID=2745 RepID=UPI004034A5FC
MRVYLPLLFVLLCGMSLLTGARQISGYQLITLSDDAWLTLTASRLPRLITVSLTGVGLAICGVILQHIVRNKFVEPATSGGLDAAKLGILVSLSLMPTAGAGSRMLAALLFCFAANVVFIAIVRRIKFTNTVLVPVIGLMYGGVLSALAEFYAYRLDILPSLSLRCRLAAERKGIPRSLPSWFLLRCSLPSMPWHCWSYTNSTGVHSRVPLGMIFQPSAPANSAVPACRMLRAAFTSRSMP